MALDTVVAESGSTVAVVEVAVAVAVDVDVDVEAVTSCGRLVVLVVGVEVTAVKK